MGQEDKQQEEDGSGDGLGKGTQSQDGWQEPWPARVLLMKLNSEKAANREGRVFRPDTTKIYYE